MRKQWITLAVFAAFSLVACDQPGCPPGTQANTILSQSPVDSEEYQQELQRLVTLNPEEVDYYFEKRIEISGRNYLALNCYGDEFCGELWLLVEKEDQWSERLQNVSGYRGAKLKGLVFRISPLNDPRELVFEKVESILD